MIVGKPENFLVRNGPDLMIQRGVEVGDARQIMGIIMDTERTRNPSEPG